jgi:hypothetical protein
LFPNFASLVPIWIARQMASRVVSSGPSLLSSLLLASNQSRNWSRTLRYFIGNQVLAVVSVCCCSRCLLTSFSPTTECRKRKSTKIGVSPRYDLYILFFPPRALLALLDDGHKRSTISGEKRERGVWLSMCLFETTRE